MGAGLDSDDNKKVVECFVLSIFFDTLLFMQVVTYIMPYRLLDGDYDEKEPKQPQMHHLGSS